MGIATVLMPSERHKKATRFKKGVTFCNDISSEPIFNNCFKFRSDGFKY
jgi:hypothetical protein